MERIDMAKFVTIGYGDREGYERLSEDKRAAAHVEDAKLQTGRPLLGVAHHNATGSEAAGGIFHALVLARRGLRRHRGR
jgi:hypothetical protein